VISAKRNQQNLIKAAQRSYKASLVGTRKQTESVCHKLEWPSNIILIHFKLKNFIIKNAQIEKLSTCTQNF
jgi:hypothetical protein